MSNSRRDIKRSLDAYLDVNVSGVSIDYEGLQFNAAETMLWLQPRIVDINYQYHRQGGVNQYAETANILYQINIFMRKSGVTTSDRHWGLRDDIARYFKIGADIALSSSGTTAISGTSMRIRDVITDNPILENSDFYQYAIAWELDYTKLTTK